MKSVSTAAMVLSSEEKRNLLAEVIAERDYKTAERDYKMAERDCNEAERDCNKAEGDSELLERHENALWPLSLAQRRLWFLEQLEPGAAHQICSGLRLNGNIDVAALEWAVQSILARHEALRTAFVTVGCEMLQKVAPAADIEIAIEDVNAVPAEVREWKAYEMACAEACRPFDIESSPLIRVKLIRMSPCDHILLFVMHHLVSDGWSVEVFVRELTALYEARVEGRPCELPAISVQYSDYSEWQRESLAREELESQVLYWKAKLAGIPALVELPTDHARSAEQSFACSALSVQLPAPVIEALTALAQREDTTLFTILLAAFHVLLFRYSHQEDVCIGVPVSGRSQIETETLIGLFVNTLVVRADLSGNLRFRDLLEQVRQTLLEAHANQDVPFEKVVEEIQPKRSLAYNPLFQVMMTAVKGSVGVGRFGPLEARPYTVAASTSTLDLSAYVVEGAAGTLWLRLEYNTALFSPLRIHRMMAHYQKLLVSILQNPDRRVGDLDLLSLEELDQLAVWNDTCADYPKMCVQEWIGEQAARTPDAVALVFESRSLTYSELDRRARQVVTALRTAGARPGSRIGICLERSAEMVIGVVGILQSGGAYVPLNPSQPFERLAFMAQDAEVDLILTDSHLAERLSYGRPVLIEDAWNMAPAKAEAPQDPESLAYILFTSGSTGQPKGVAVPHRAVVNLLAAMQHELRLSPDDRFLAVTNLCFDISALEIFWPLVTGARLVIAGQDTLFDGAKLITHLDQYGITAMQATPSTWRLLIEAGWTRATSDLKVLCGGEALPADLADQLTLRSDSVWNLYGPTETTIWSSLSRVKWDCPPAIGRPVRNTRFYVLDPRMRRVGIGLPGELYIGGDGLAAGYWNRPDLTRDRFVPNPFETGGGRLYRTGDTVRFRADGELEYLGRLDSQVKVRGMRIELGEVESVANEHPAIQQAVAIVREDAPGDQRLVCYAVVAHGTQTDAGGVREFLQRKLPDYMVPTVQLIDSLPITSNGKIDRKRLPALVAPAVVSAKPRNSVETRLLAVWKRVLGIAGIGIHDNFFELGGHSLLAMQLLAEVEKAFGTRLPVATIFSAQTVEQMAAVLSEGSVNPVSSAVAFQTDGGLPPLFIVPLADGSPFAYADLAKALGADQPVYVLEYLGLEAGKPLERIEEIAEYFIREIRKIAPRGPYRLAGFCMGGVIAFEMAQQLVAAGEEAPRLAMVETWHPSSIPTAGTAPAAFRSYRFLAEGVARHLAALSRLGPGEAIRYIREKSAIVKEMLLSRDVYRGNRKHYEHRVFEANYRAGARYEPAYLPGCIRLFLAGGLEVDPALDTRLAWRDLSEEVSITKSTGTDVIDLLKGQHMGAFAESLKIWLCEPETVEALQEVKRVS